MTLTNKRIRPIRKFTVSISHPPFPGSNLATHEISIGFERRASFEVIGTKKKFMFYLKAGFRKPEYFTGHAFVLFTLSSNLSSLLLQVVDNFNSAN